MNEQLPLTIPSSVALLTSKFAPIILPIGGSAEPVASDPDQIGDASEAGWVILDLL
jgi:hypothetical protein